MPLFHRQKFLPEKIVQFVTVFAFVRKRIFKIDGCTAIASYKTTAEHFMSSLRASASLLCFVAVDVIEALFFAAFRAVKLKSYGQSTHTYLLAMRSTVEQLTLCLPAAATDCSRRYNLLCLRRYAS